MGARLTAGQQTLNLLVEVRILCPQPLLECQKDPGTCQAGGLFAWFFVGTGLDPSACFGSERSRPVPTRGSGARTARRTVPVFLREGIRSEFLSRGERLGEGINGFCRCNLCPQGALRVSNPKGLVAEYRDASLRSP